MFRFVPRMGDASPADTVQRSRWGASAFLPPIAIVVAVFAAYLNSFPGAFVFDDFSSIVDNASIRTLSSASVLSPPPTAGVGGRPLANLSFALNHAVTGLRPPGFRAVNVALHAVAALTLFGLLHRTFSLPVFSPIVVGAAQSLATALALLWALHPLDTAVVNYASQRTELLMALCYLLTLYSTARLAETQRTRWQLLGIITCAAGMLAKEVMVTAPVLTLFYDRIFLAGSWRGALRRRPVFYLGLAATWLLLAAMIAGSQLAERGVGFDQGVTWTSYAATQLVAVGHYLRLALLPVPLVFDYGDALTLGNAARACAWVVLLLAGGLALLSARRPGPLAFGLLAPFILLAPTSSIVPIVQQPAAESRMYLPLACLVATGGVAAFGLLQRRGSLLLIAGCIAFLLLTSSRNADYHSEITLWSDTAAKQPQSARAHGNLAAALLRQGETTRALAAAETAVQLKPNYAEAHHNLGLALARLGRTDAAMTHYETALRLAPASADTHYNLAELLLTTGRNDAAILLLERTVRLNPRHALAFNNLSVARLNQGNAAAAATSARAALAIDPNLADAHYNLGTALARLGDRPAAIASFEAALQLRPSLVRAHNNLGALLLQDGNRASAREHFEAALKIDPAYLPARQNLDRLIQAER